MAFQKKDDGIAIINPANILGVTIKINGVSPLVQNKFSKKAREKMMADMSLKASDKKAKSARPPRDYASDFEQCQHIAVGAWHGVPCAAFRAAMIDACRTINMVMTRAKMSIFIMPDGFDRDDGTPLVRIIADAPERIESLVRNDNGGADVRIRAMWRKWSAQVTIEFDADMVSASSIVNLLDRAGRQVGIGEGRNFSKNSVGQGWGTFTVEAQNETLKQAA